MYKRIFAGIGVVGILVLSISIAAPSVSALTVGELQSQIRELLARVAELTKQLNAIQGSGTSAEGASGEVTGSGTITAAFAPSKHRVCEVLKRNLSQGTSGNDVTSLQEFLHDEGHFSANATGYFGPLTAAALARWQTSQGVEGVGVVGPLTRERIKLWCGVGNTERFNAEPQRGTAPLAVVFKTNVTLTNPDMVADAGDYKIVFGDGSEQKLSCSSQTGICPGPHRVDHTYTSNGTYTASLVHYGYFGTPGPDGTTEQVVGRVAIYVGDNAGCTKEYKPICGSKPIVCITTPCNPIPQTYSNRCMMEAEGASFLYEGVCRTDTGNKPPVVSSFSGPTGLAVNETGTWAVQASDPENQNLSYRISWGDENFFSNLTASITLESFVQTTTFTHTYSVAGVYTVKIVVRDPSGKEAKTTTTVKVGETAICTLEYAPVCGQPPEPACRRSIPACMMATPGPQTYGNRCQLQASGATFLYEGECATYPIACTADAKLCPDGSYVGRTGPNCEFVCPTQTPAASCVYQGVTYNHDELNPSGPGGAWLPQRCCSGTWRSSMGNLLGAPECSSSYWPQNQ